MPARPPIDDGRRRCRPPPTTTTTTTAATASRTMTRSTTTTMAETAIAFGPEDVANLPLLLPFEIRNPSESVLIQAIVNEQHASDALMAAMKCEQTLRTELQKAATLSSLENKDEKIIAKKNGAGAADAGAGAGATKKGGTAVGNANSKKKVKQSSMVILLRKSIEREINNQLHVVAQCQRNLQAATNWTFFIVHNEYSKLVVLLEPESRQYADLEEAYTFLSARVGKVDAILTDTQPAEYFHEQRIAYVREMLPIMKQVGVRGDMRVPIAALPYVRQLQCEEDRLLGALRDEMQQLTILHGLRAQLFDDKNHDPAQNKILRLATETLARREAETCELVRKWYRRRSLKIHPDRNGEHMRPAFEEFTDACNVLSDTRLRRTYIRDMLNSYYFYRATNPTTDRLAEELLASHDLWNRENRPDKVEGVNESVKKDTTGKNETTLRLEGGLHHQMPKGVIWRQRYEQQSASSRSTKAVVNISIHALSPIHDFYARVRSVCVELKSTSNETHTFRLSRADIVKTIRMDGRIPILASEITVVEKSLNPGNWEAYWFAELDTIGTDPLNPKNATKNEAVSTRHSAVRSFEIVDHNHASLVQKFEQAESNCKVVRGELTSILHKLRKNHAESVPGRTLLLPFELSRERYGLYHQTLVRARKKCHALNAIMAQLGRKSTICDELSVLLSQSRQVFSELEEAVVANNKRQEKKADVKRFKSYIASILEGDDPMTWMKNVTSAELLCQGGDVNRLYQLFIEGKGQLALMFDSEVFNEASFREDLFSAKQRKDLAAKGDEAAAVEAKEEEEASAAEVKRKADEAELEKLKKEGELRESWAMVGQNATIHGLTSEMGKQLNNQLAEIVYFHVDNDRFEVRLYNSDMKKRYMKPLLKRENLAIYYGHVTASKSKKPLQEQPTNRNVDKVVHQPQLSSTHKVISASSVANDNSGTESSMRTASNPTESNNGTITITEGGDRSSTTNSTMNENDPLLMFLRSQHHCIKGNIEEFYTWLNSEDIDSMSALKEAVSDDEYLEYSMKVGCGKSGLKGFKRKAFQRAVLEYKQPAGDEILSAKHSTSSQLRSSPTSLLSFFDIGH